MAKKDTKTKEFAVVTPEVPKNTYEINRPASADCAIMCRKLQWFSKENKRLYMYSLFALVLLAFIVTYIIKNDPLLYMVASVALLFVLYIVAHGHSVFASGMNGDEDEEQHRLQISFGEDAFSVKFGTDVEEIGYDNINSVVEKDKYYYIKLKNSDKFKTGIIFIKDSFEKGDPETFVSFIKEKTK